MAIAKPGGAEVTNSSQLAREFLPLNWKVSCPGNPFSPGQTDTFVTLAGDPEDGSHHCRQGRNQEGAGFLLIL